MPVTPKELTAVIKTAFEIYDFAFLDALKLKFPSLPNSNWQIYPASLAFRSANDNFGEAFMPLFNVFRPVPQPQQGLTVPALMQESMKVNESLSINAYIARLNYQVDFFTINSYYCNMAIHDWFRYIYGQRILEFDFTNFGLNYKYKARIYPEEPQDLSDVDKMFDIGLYFRYTFNIGIDAMIFDKVPEKPLKTMVFSIYTNNKLQSEITQTKEACE